MPAYWNRPAVLLFVCLLAASCSDSDNHSDDNGSETTAACPADYVVGRWQFTGAEVRTSYEFNDKGGYHRYEQIIDLDLPGFDTQGTYQLGNRVTNENGLEVCAIRTTVGDAPPGCVEHVYVHDALLYLSDCELRLDFDRPYDYVGKPLN